MNRTTYEGDAKVEGNECVAIPGESQTSAAVAAFEERDTGSPLATGAGETKSEVRISVPTFPLEDFLPEPLPLRRDNPSHGACTAQSVPGAHAMRPSAQPRLRRLFYTTPRVDTSVYYGCHLPEEQDEMIPTPHNQNDDGLVEAQPVLDEEDPTTAQAVPVSSASKSRGPFSFLQTSLLAVLALLLSGGIMAGAMCGTGRCNHDEPTVSTTNPVPKEATSAPTLYYRDPLEAANIEFEIKYVLGRNYFDVSPNGHSFAVETRQKALNWMLYQDPLQLQSSDSQHLLQRFLLVHFYFHTTKETPWAECNPSPLGQTASYCYFPKYFSEFVLGRKNVIWGDFWLSASHECKWAGVTCDVDHREVTELALQCNNLNGPLPWELSRLTGLVTLDFGSNHLSGTISKYTGPFYSHGKPDSTDFITVSLYSDSVTEEMPWEFSRLTALVYLNLRNNSIFGTIPSELRLPNSLQDLDLSYNFLEGSLPSELLDSNHITILLLDNNLITGTLPEWSSDIHLTTLFLANNLLSGSLPEDIFASTVLDTIRLDGNSQLLGTLPPILSSESALLRISVAGTALSGIVPSEIGLASSLLGLEFANTNMGGIIPEELYQGLSDLMWLDLTGCNFSGAISTSIGLMINLHQLMIANNNFSGKIPDEIGLLTKLSHIALNGNNFTIDSIPQVLCEFRNPDPALSAWTLIADCWPDAETGVPEMACPSTCCTSCCNPKTDICYKI